MDDLRLARDLSAAGVTSVELRHAVRSGASSRVRRGAYTGSPSDDPLLAHRRLLAATLAQGHPGAVVSHQSAAVLHDLPVRHATLDRVHLTRDRRGGGQRRSWVQVHGQRLDPVDVVVIEGVRVTSLARTVVDLACALSLRHAVAIGDAAATSGLRPYEVAQVRDRVGARHGIASARRALDLIDPRSESYGESVSRVVMLEHGIAEPELQLVVHDDGGGFLGRCDFAWPELGVLGEFDGRVKYGRAFDAASDPAETVWREKLREDRLRDLGWQVVRWVWADLENPAAWLERLSRALRRGDLRPAL